MTLRNISGRRVPREVLKADRTYYVRTDGNDANDGSANTAGKAFLTLQKAYDTIATIDGAGFVVTIQAGTMTGNLLCNKNVVGIAGIVLDLGGGTLIGKVYVGRPMSLTVRNGTYTNTVDHVLTADGPGAEILVAASVTFGAATGQRHINAVQNGKVTLSSGYTITGGAAYHYFAQLGGLVVNLGVAVTLTGTPAFSSSFAYADTSGTISAFPGSFTGAATGKRYSAITSGIINTFGSGPNHFPGNVQGTVTNGGVYDSLVGGVRELLTATRTYYVRSDGNDANTGLANTAAGAFLTPQKAMDTISDTLDLGAFNVIVQIADGTYTGPVTLSSYVGRGGVTFQGNAGTPANVLFNVSGTCFNAYFTGGRWTIKDMELRATGHCINMDGPGNIFWSNIRFGLCSNAHVRATQGAQVEASGPYAVTGNAAFHLLTGWLATIMVVSKTITFLNNPAFSISTVYADTLSYVQFFSNVLTNGGTVTGKRYTVGVNGSINVAGGAASAIPGSTPGSVGPGGQYN